MENLSGYDLAQQRIAQRQRKRNHTLIWLILSVIFFFLSTVVGGCTVPLLVISATFAVSSGIGWYFNSTKWTPPESQVNQEMAWLFGDDWQDTSGIHEFSLAHERIQKRRSAQMNFLIHLVFFLVVTGLLVSLMFYNLYQYRTFNPPIVLIVPFFWLALLVTHGVNAFPSRVKLARREIQAGEAIRRELDRMQLAKLKNDTKVKRDKYYTVGDDGELVEVDSEPLDGEDSQSRLFGDNA